MEPAIPDCPTSGVWVTYTYDGGPVAVRPFACEIDALRWANDNPGYNATFLTWGEEVDR